MDTTWENQIAGGLEVTAPAERSKWIIREQSDSGSSLSLESNSSSWEFPTASEKETILNNLKKTSHIKKQSVPAQFSCNDACLNTSSDLKKKVQGVQSVNCEEIGINSLNNAEEGTCKIFKHASQSTPAKGFLENRSVIPESETICSSRNSVLPESLQTSDPYTLQTCFINDNIRNFFSSFILQNSASDLAARLETVKSHPLVTSIEIESTLSSGDIYTVDLNSETESISTGTSNTCGCLPPCNSACSVTIHQKGRSLNNTTSFPLDILEMNSAGTNKPSREQVEAERKARKVAKQAAKIKSIGTSGKDGASDKEGNLHKDKISIDSQKKSLEQHQILKQNKPSSKSCAEKLTDSLQKLQLQAPSQSEKPKAADEPDFVSLRKPINVVNIEEFQGVTKKGIGFDTNIGFEYGDQACAKSVVEQTPSVVLKDDDVGKSKAQLRAERRAKQEAQRAAKVSLQQKVVQPKQKQTPLANAPQSSKTEKAVAKPAKETKSAKGKIECGVKLFSHLNQNSYKSIWHIVGLNHPQYHPAIVRLGVHYAKRTILGSNARCIALLYALKEVISDYTTPPEKEFSRGLEGYLHPNVELLHQCRPQSVSMINAMRYVKWQLAQLSNSVSDIEAKQKLHEAIEQYIFEQIGKAAEAIGKAVKDKISDNDVILVYACSSLVLSALKVAFDEGRQFRVIVVDSLPWLEGREMLRRLVSLGVKCSYVHISAASFVMREVSKVLLGAHALLANGYVMSRAGSSQVALLAHTYNKPVLVCCETHKFSERVLTDSFVYNELGDPDELIGARRAEERESEKDRPLANWRDLPHLSLLNFVYDVTPPDLVTAVVTERAILPCTSVPVILRIKPIEC